MRKRRACRGGAIAASSGLLLRESHPGYARLATLMQERQRALEARGPVLGLDAGDFTMGSAVGAAARQTGAELRPGAGGAAPVDRAREREAIHRDHARRRALQALRSDRDRCAAGRDYD
jgi:hypothetical protein